MNQSSSDIYTSTRHGQKRRLVGNKSRRMRRYGTKTSTSIYLSPPIRVISKIVAIYGSIQEKSSKGVIKRTTSTNEKESDRLLVAPSHPHFTLFKDILEALLYSKNDTSEGI
jgi:hypothetical protein